MTESERVRETTRIIRGQKFWGESTQRGISTKIIY